jgi:hypothetical protein
MWLTSAGSVFAVGHLLAIVMLALAARSGPWLMSDGRPSPGEGPLFATLLNNDFFVPYYLQPLRMTHNYHFESDRPVTLGIAFEVTLKDDDGVPIRTLKFPDPKANFWVRHRQRLLAKELGNDQFLAPRGSDPVPATKKELPKVEIWEPVEKDKKGELRLKQMVILEIKHDRQYEHPSETAKAMVRSYTRHLCQKYNAASAELVRFHQVAIRPERLIVPEQPDEFLITKSHFGEYRRER